jgi:hypothetical protein
VYACVYVCVHTLKSTPRKQEAIGFSGFFTERSENIFRMNLLLKSCLRGKMQKKNFYFFGIRKQNLRRIIKVLKFLGALNYGFILHHKSCS